MCAVILLTGADKELNLKIDSEIIKLTATIEGLKNADSVHFNNQKYSALRFHVETRPGACVITYKHIVHGHMSVLTAKLPYSQTTGHEAMKMCLFFSVNYGRFSRQKNKRDKLQIFVRDDRQMSVNMFIIQATRGSSYTWPQNIHG